jgi:hypothetical protein
MSDGPAGVALRTSLASAAVQSDGAAASHSAMLRQRVFAAVDELKSTGWPVERIIVRLKEVAIDAGLRASGTAHRSSRAAGDGGAIVDDVVRWCIERYYGPESPSDA